MKPIKVISVTEAARIMTEYGYPMNPQKLRLGLQQGVYPFGVCIKMSDWCYDIFEWQLLKWLSEQAGEQEKA